MSELNIEAVPLKKENSETLLNEPFYTKYIRENYLYFALLSLGFGLFYTFCLYKNLSGITFPVFVSGTLLCLYLASRKMQLPWERNSLIYLPVMLFIGISTCLTDNSFFHVCNILALFLLTWVFIIRQFYRDKHWDFERYFFNFIRCAFTSIGCLPLPFIHFSSFRKTKTGKNPQIAYIALGALIAVPLLCVILSLLINADAAFAYFIDKTFGQLFFDSSWIQIILMIGIGFLLFYSCLCGVSRLNLAGENANSKKWPASLGMTILLLLTFVYLVFCCVQIIVLFSHGAMILPKDYTYAQYARQGFFELLYVSIINLIIVFIWLSKFQEHLGLKAVLSMFCGCTFFLIGSSAYRMILYIREYDLTFLRILVLWFLCLLFLLILGVIITIYKRNFPLFRYCIVVVTALYMGLLCMRTDSLIMRYNLSRQETITLSDIYYYTDLSADAAPYIAGIDLKQIEAEDADYAQEILSNYFKNLNQDPGIRTFNFSRARAARIAAEYLR